MTVTSRSIKGLDLTESEFNLVVYNNLMAVKKMLCINMGENVSICVATVNSLQKHIFN